MQTSSFGTHMICLAFFSTMSTQKRLSFTWISKLLESKSHPGFLLTSQVWSDPHPHEWMVFLRVRAAVYFLHSRIMSCHSLSACWESSSSSVLSHNFQWQFDSWKEWLWMTCKLDGNQHSPGLLGGAFLLSGKGRPHRWCKNATITK